MIFFVCVANQHGCTITAACELNINTQGIADFWASSGSKEFEHYIKRKLK